MHQFSDYALRVSLKGIANISIPAGQVVTHTFNVTQKTILTGAEYFRKGNDSDTVSFILKVNGVQVASIADNIFLGDEGKYEFYQAVLNPGLSVELVYTNNGAADANFRYNIISHVEKI